MLAFVHVLFKRALFVLQLILTTTEKKVAQLKILQKSQIIFYAIQSKRFDSTILIKSTEVCSIFQRFFEILEYKIKNDLQFEFHSKKKRRTKQERLRSAKVVQIC